MFYLNLTPLTVCTSITAYACVGTRPVRSASTSESSPVATVTSTSPLASRLSNVEKRASLLKS